MRCLLLVLPVLMAAWFSDAACEPDDLEAKARAGRWALRWDDPEGRVHWADRPGKPHRVGQALELERGDEIELPVPARAHLRLLSPPDWALRPEDVSAWIDNGTGLALELEPTVAGEELHLHSPLDDPGLVRLRRAKTTERSDADATLALRLFVSRELVPPAAVRYRDSIPLPGDAGRVNASRTGGGETFVHLPPRSPVKVELEGPRRLALISRLNEPTGDAGWDGEYRILARLDGRPLRTIEHLTVPDRRRPVTLDSLARVLGRPERGYIQIPDGHHRLSLEANANLLVRLLARAEPDYLFPELNRPRALDTVQAPPPPVCTPAWAAVRPPPTPAANWCRALGLARNNRHGPGGMAATELLRTQAVTRPELPQLYGDARKVRGRYSLYRDLLPTGRARDIRHATFPTPRLLALGEVRRLLLDTAGHRASADRLADGAFVALDDTELVYHIPQPASDGSLRLAVAGRGVLWLQLNGQAPVRLQARPRQPDERFQLDPAWESQETAGASLSAPRTRPAPLVAAAAVEVPLPRSVAGFRLWSEQGSPLWVATAYRTAVPYRIPERGYLDLLDRVGAERALAALGKALDSDRESAASDPEIAELHNAWLPWIRALNAQLRRFSFNVVATEPLPLAPPLGAADLQRLRRRAAAVTDAEAVRAWAELARHSRGAARSEALLRLADALDGAGEAYLAERLRRNLVLRDTPRAVGALAKRYREDGDIDALEALAAVQFRRHPGRETLLTLVGRLAEQGRSREVLELGLLLLRRNRPSDALRVQLLDSALDQGWERTFARLVRDLPKSERQRWQGHQAAKRGDWQEALDHYRAAGADQELRTLRQALEVRTRLTDNRAEVRAAALADWSAQQSAGAGALRWRPAPWLATTGSGIELTDAEIPRFQSRLLARPDAPVQLRVSGPVRLRLEVRLLHDSLPQGQQERLEDWLLIRQGDRVRRVPLPTSRPVPNLERIGGGARPGRRFEHILELPAGEHAIAISAHEAPMALGLALEQPLVAWLGPRTPAATALVRAGGWGRDPRSSATQARASRPLTLLTTTGGSRMPARPLPTPGTAWTALPTAERVGPLPKAELEGPSARMSGLLWRRERAGTLTPEVLVAASRLLAENPGDARLVQLGQRLLRGTRWEPLEQLEGGAGLHLRELPAWQPDNPALRARLALLAPPLPGESLLLADARLALDLYNPVPSPLRLELSLDGPGFLPLENATVQVSVDGAPRHRVPLSAPGPRQTLDLNLSAGEHHVQILVPNPVTHQLVRLRVLEPRGGELIPVGGDLRRGYDIATREQPLVAHVSGPAWLRLDEWRDGESRATYQAVGPGWQELVLIPEDGHDERLLRLFVLTPPATGDEPRMAESRPMPVAGPPLPTPELSPGAGAAPYAAAAGPDVSELPLGGQEDGTWSLRLGLIRNAGIDGDEEQGNPDEYMELEAGYREQWPSLRAWWRGEVLSRWRDDGRPTLGLRARFYRQPKRLPFDYDLRGAWYGQWLPDDLAWSGNASLTLSRRMELGPKSHHRARLTLFGRHLSSDRPPAQTEVDRDVYSDYKRDHRYGLRYTHDLYGRPWRDSQWRLGLRLATNERLYSLDHTALRAGWRQRLGAFGLDGELRWTRYLGDDDRTSALDRRRLALGIAWEGWRGNGHRLELGLRWLKDFDNADYGLMLGLSWHPSRGRGFRDFAPEEIQFRDLRTWRQWDLDNGP